jgi:acyl carrier protein
MTNYVDVVKEAASKLKLVDPTGSLVPLDSLTVLELAAAIEKTAKIKIPIANMRLQVFRSIDSIASMLAELED